MKIRKIEVERLREQGKTWSEIAVKFDCNKGQIWKFYHGNKDKVDLHSKPRRTKRKLLPVWEIFTNAFGEDMYTVLRKAAQIGRNKYDIIFSVEDIEDYVIERWLGLSENQYVQFSDKNKYYIWKTIMSDIQHFTRKTRLRREYESLCDQKFFI